MRRSAAPLVRALAIAVLAALPIAQIGACSGETGVTPTCVPNIDENGIQIGVDDGCTGFAVCAANPAKPATCCKSADGKELTGSELSLCLFFYGAAPAPTSSATSTGSSTSTGTGSGGAGGGN
jgi:hypothetical protein